MPEARMGKRAERSFPQPIGKVCHQRRLAQISGLESAFGFNPNCELQLQKAEALAGSRVSLNETDHRRADQKDRQH